MKRGRFMLIAVVVFAVMAAAVLSGIGTRRVSGDDRPAADQWEYLIIGSPSNVNLTPTDNPSMRKESGSFAQENFVLEGHMDKLGKKGWELVTVTPDSSRMGSTFIFKRRK